MTDVPRPYDVSVELQVEKREIVGEGGRKREAK